MAKSQTKDNTDDFPQIFVENYLDSDNSRQPSQSVKGNLLEDNDQMAQRFQSVIGLPSENLMMGQSKHPQPNVKTRSTLKKMLKKPKVDLTGELTTPKQNA